MSEQTVQTSEQSRVITKDTPLTLPIVSAIGAAVMIIMATVFVVTKFNNYDQSISLINKSLKRIASVIDGDSSSRFTPKDFYIACLELQLSNKGFKCTYKHKIVGGSVEKK